MNTSTLYRCCEATANENLKDISFSIFHSIDAINYMQWDKYIPEANVLMQHDSLKVIEDTHRKNMEFKYVLVKQNDVTIGSLYFQTVYFRASQLINYFPATTDKTWFLNALKFLTQKVLKLINLKLLVSGNVFMTGENGFYFNADIDKALRASILRKAINTIIQTDSSIKSVLVSDLYLPKTEFDTDFLSLGYNQITVESDMSIELKSEWKSFDDYLLALSSKYRVRAKKVFSTCAESNVIVKDLSAEEIAIHQDTIYALYENVMRNADFKLAELSKDFFREQKLQQPDRYKIHGYFIGDEMIGFISAFVLGKKMEVHYTGMNHDKCKPIHLYQYMMYDMIKLGIQSTAERLHFGRTAPEIKSTIGATPSPMYGYLKHTNYLFNKLVVKPYTANLKPKEYVFRNPFKGF